MFGVKEAKKFYAQMLCGTPKMIFLHVDHEIKVAIAQRFPHTYISTTDLNTIMDLEKYLEEAGFKFKSWLNHDYSNDVIIITKVWGWAD
jgi:hypothetical protein